MCDVCVVVCQVFRDEKYLRDAVECGELIWQRGLLRKGYGLCHGSAGNGYALLSLYHATQDKKHLHRACKVQRHVPSLLGPVYSRCTVDTSCSSSMETKQGLRQFTSDPAAGAV